MTSKNSFFKSMKQDLEQRIWLPVVFFIIGFLCLEVTLVSRFDIWQDRADFVERMTRYLMNSFFSPGSGFMILTVAVAVVSAISGFMYMHSAKKLDVYHSMPIKREKLFLRQYVYGILYYIVPLVFHALICFAICAAHGMAGGMILGQIVGFVLVQILIYLTCYSVAVAAVVLTGNLVISVLGSAILFFYSLVLAALKFTLTNQFFMTYYDNGTRNHVMDIPTFSPVHLIIKMTYAMDQVDTSYLNYTDHMGYYGKLVLMAVIYTAIALFLYKKRPTEVAGKTMAFSFTEPIVKTMVVFPSAFMSGYLFSNFASSNNELAWFIFGCVFGFVIACPLMEVIFQKDVKAVLAHPLQIVFNGACVIGVILVLYFDTFGYDTYIPEADKVESYAVSFSEMPYIYINYGNAVEYRLENMEITDNESVRMLLEHAAEVTCPARTGKLSVEEDQDVYYSSLVVRYNLKNGETVYRSYLINFADEQVMQWMEEVCDSMEYKLGAYPVLAESHEKNYIGVILEYAYASESIQLSEEKMQQFVDTYQRELTNLTFEEMLTEVPVANLSFAKANPDVELTYTMDQKATRVYSMGTGFEYYSEESGYEIYPSFTQTIALLEEYGATIVNEIPAEDVITLTVVDDHLEVDDFDGQLTKQIELEYRVTEGQTEEIGQILSSIVSNQLTGNLCARERVEENIYVDIHYYYDGQERYTSGYILKGMIPAFLQEDIEEAAAVILQEQ